MFMSIKGLLLRRYHCENLPTGFHESHVHYHFVHLVNSQLKRLLRQRIGNNITKRLALAFAVATKDIHG